MNALQPDGKNTHHTLTAQVKVTAWIASYFSLLQLLMSTWYCCSYFRVLHDDLLPELAVAIHDMKSEGNVRSSHLACCSTSINKRTVHPKKNLHFLTMEVKVTLILYEKRAVCSINGFGNTWRWECFSVICIFNHWVWQKRALPYQNQGILSRRVGCCLKMKKLCALTDMHTTIFSRTFVIKAIRNSFWGGVTQKDCKGLWSLK